MHDEVESSTSESVGSRDRELLRACLYLSASRMFSATMTTLPEIVKVRSPESRGISGGPACCNLSIIDLTAIRQRTVFVESTPQLHDDAANIMKLSIFFLGLANLAVAARLDIRVPPSAALPNPGTLSSTTHAVLLGPTSVRYDAPLRRDTSFSFPSIQDASYLLTIHSRDHVFPPLRIDVSKSGEVSRVSAWQTFRGNEWSNKGPLFGNATDALAIDVRAIGRKVFYVERGGFNFLGFLKSPMILMGLFSVALIFGMPYIMNNSTSSPLYSSPMATLTIRKWTRRPRPSLRKCSAKVPWGALMVLSTSYRTLISLVGWRANLLLVVADHRPAARRRSNQRRRTHLLTMRRLSPCFVAPPQSPTLSETQATVGSLSDPG